MAEGDLGAFLDELQPVRATARISARADLVARHEELEAALVDALRNDQAAGGIGDPQAAPAIAEQLVALEAEIEGSARTFTFEAIGNRAWLDLIAEHPPSAEQRDEGLDHDPSTFPRAAILASCVEPRLSAEQVEVLENRLNLAQWRQLWQACLAANIGNDSSPKSLAATAVLRRSGASSTTAPLEGSLAASS